MSKNAIHNFNLSIKNSADIKSSEHLTEAIIKELAKVSKEINQQKDIEQLWEEQKALNTIANNSSFSTGEGINGAPKLVGTTSSVAETTISTFNASIGEGVANTTGSSIMSSAESANNTSPIQGAKNNTNTIMSLTYASVAAQQTLTVPQMLQAGIDEPSIEIIKEEIKKKLDEATAINDTVAIDYWNNISKAFKEGYTAKDFDGKPEHTLFTQMYAALKQANQVITAQNFSWDIIRRKMIESIDANILSGKISDKSKERWTIIKQKLNDDKINIANLFEQYDELFLLLKEVEGLNSLPTTITITTKTKIYPNLSADRVYPPIGKEAVYVFLKEISDVYGSEVNKGAVKISNAEGSSFIVGENLKFMLNETFIKDKGLQKQDINWIVYHVEKKESSIFRDKGTSLSYNFDQAGTYRIDAYGKSATINAKKNAAETTFIELSIVKQQIMITSPGITKDGLARTSTKEKSFKVALKNLKVKTLNPLKFYYQVESKTANKVTIISEEQEVDSTGIIKFPTPNSGEYSIKVSSKDQYALNFDYKFNAIKNEVTSIGQVKNTANKGVFLVGDPNNKLTLEVKNFRINPATDEEKEDVKWIIYDANNKPYLPPGSVVMTDSNNPKKRHLHKWSYFDVPLPKKEGNYTVEAYSDTMQGVKAKSVFSIEMTRPQITEAYWASGGRSKKQVSGFEGERNWVKANIPYYNNQTVRIYFYLGKTKTKYYCDVKTNKNGEIFQEIKFDSNFKKLIGFQKGNHAKIGFKLLGIQNGKPYPFKTPKNYESDTVLSVTTEVKILDAYFMYDGIRVKAEDEIPFSKKGTTVTIVAKTQNLVGKEIVLTAHKVSEDPAFRHEVKVNSEGVASIGFIIKPVKDAKNRTVNKYYVGIEGYSTKHLNDKMMNLVVGARAKSNIDTGIYSSHFDENMIHIFDVEKGYVDDENDRGGKTNRGITYETYKNFYKIYEKIEKTEKDLQNLSITDAKRIYKVEFWNKIHGDEIYNASVALYVFDFAIHSGVTNATEVVQETLKDNFQINGITGGGFGTRTTNSINRVDSKIFYQKLDQNRRRFIENFIKKNPSQKKYEKGWENRLNKLEYKKEEYTINQKIESWLKKEYKQSPIKDKNSSIANLILEAHALNLVEFNTEGTGSFDSGLGGTQDTFIKIRDGIEIGNGLGNAVPKQKFDPNSENIPIIEKALKIIQSNVQNWVNNNYIPKEPDKLKLGSFMVWNTSSDGIAGALRGSSHGNKASAIDFNLSTFSNVKISFNTSNAEKMVLDIIKSLPKADYGFGLPVQGNFFPDLNGLLMKKSIYNGEYNKAYTRLKSEAIKEEIEKRMKDNRILVFPDNPDHLHVQLLKEV